MAEGIKELIDNSSAYIDKTLGNNDDQVSIDEINKFRQVSRDSVGLQVLYEMMDMYSAK